MDYTFSWRDRTLLDIFELDLLDDTWGRTHSLMMDILSSLISFLLLNHDANAGNGPDVDSNT